MRLAAMGRRGQILSLTARAAHRQDLLYIIFYLKFETKKIQKKFMRRDLGSLALALCLAWILYAGLATIHGLRRGEGTPVRDDGGPRREMQELREILNGLSRAFSKQADDLASIRTSIGGISLRRDSTFDTSGLDSVSVSDHHTQLSPGSKPPQLAAAGNGVEITPPSLLLESSQSDSNDGVSMTKESSSDNGQRTGLNIVSAELERRGLKSVDDISRMRMSRVSVSFGGNGNAAGALRSAAKASQDPSAVCVDAGGNKGDYTNIITVAACGKIYVYEADPRNCRLLQGRFGRNPRMSVHCKAISYFDGPGTFLIEDVWAGGPKNVQSHGYLRPALEPGHTPPPHFRAVDVQVASIESVVPRDQRISVFKIDIQGGESMALLGAVDWIKAGLIDSMVIEVSTTGIDGLLICYLLSIGDGFQCKDHPPSISDKARQAGKRPGKTMDCIDYVKHMDANNYWTDWTCTAVRK
jgi:FkbM family methyltransferase